MRWLAKGMWLHACIVETHTGDDAAEIFWDLEPRLVLSTGHFYEPGGEPFGHKFKDAISLIRALSERANPATAFRAIVWYPECDNASEAELHGAAVLHLPLVRSLIEMRAICDGIRKGD